MVFTRKIIVTLLLVSVAGCTRLEGDNWPSLHEGFTPREVPAPMATPEQQAAEAGPVVEAPLPLGDELLSSIAAAEAHLLELIGIAEAIAADPAAEIYSHRNAWYEAQLALSRMGRFKDQLRAHPDALAELEAVLEGGRDRLVAIKPPSADE